jgi:DNA recombination protein RmuC
MGFQTLAIEQRASEVWRVLRAVKTEFSKFGESLDKVRRQIERAGKSIELTEVRTRALTRSLRDVERLPEDETSALLELPDVKPPGEELPVANVEDDPEERAEGATA